MDTLGVTFNFNNPNYSLAALNLYGDLTNQEVDLFHLADIAILENFLKVMATKKYKKLLLYDIEELEGWDDLRELVNICCKFDMDFEIVKQDINANDKVTINYLTGII